MSDFIQATADLMIDMYGHHAAAEATDRAHNAESRYDERAAENWVLVTLAIRAMDGAAFR
ncbi:MAG: hypothetical protein IT561_17465 [Alphaproteobacteria bacterium]|nr:hypothetical protein [Alphaproteobacteria bacterium]